MKFDSKKCFACMGKHICGPEVHPRMGMCSKFQQALEAVATGAQQPQETPCQCVYPVRDGVPVDGAACLKCGKTAVE